MAGKKSAQLHPTTLPVAKGITNNTIASRTPDPEWHERWLDEQIQFNTAWE